MAAATDPDPAIRYPVGLPQIPVLPPILQSIAPLQAIGMFLTGQG
jgi:hypothetical protein